MEKDQAGNKNLLRTIYVVSIAIPVVVAFLIFFPTKLSVLGSWVRILPAVHAGINSVTVVVLIAALIAIKKGAIKIHRNLMLTALVLGVLFLVSYVLYHGSVESVKFGDIDHNGIVDEVEAAAVGSTRTVYLVILASHIILSIAVVPIVLLAFYFALSDQITKHKKLVKFTFPIWLYVSVTGVVVYFLISPYYI